MASANALATRLRRGWHAEAAITENWAKKIAGNVYYFGADPEKALAAYLRERDFILAGQAPPPEEEGSAVTVRYCCNAFLESKERQKDAGELAPRTFDRYHSTAEFLVAHFGKKRDAASLRPKDFERLRDKMAMRWGPVALGNEIQIVKTILGYRREYKNLPARAVCQKSSYFDDGETAGFNEVIDRLGIEQIDMLSIRRSSVRFFRGKPNPPLRGTAVQLDDMTALLYTQGSVDFSRA